MGKKGENRGEKDLLPNMWRKRFLKTECFFVCQSCGTKYEIEEAKKLLVDVSGSRVVLDDSTQVDNLYVLARHAKANSDWSNASKYYEQILLKKPNVPL